MTAQQMVEHLAWVLECSTGRAQVECPVPEERRARYKEAFLSSITCPTPREYVNTALVDGTAAAPLTASLGRARRSARAGVDHKPNYLP